MSATTEPARAAAEAPPQRDLLLRINGREQRLRVDLRTTLLDALREHLGLTGSKKGCDLAGAAPARCWSTAAASMPA